MINGRVGVKRKLLLSLALFVWAAPALAMRIDNYKAPRGKFKEGEVIVKYKDNVRRDRPTMLGIYEKADIQKVRRFKGVFKNFEHLFLKKNVPVAEAIKQLMINPEVEYAQPNYLVYAQPVAEKATGGNTKAVPCIPGYDIPGCKPIICYIIPFWPGCDDKTPPPPPQDPGNPGDPGDPGNPPPPADPNNPPVNDKPSEVSPPAADPNLGELYGVQKIGAPDAWGSDIRGSQEIVVAVIDTGVDYNHEDLNFNMWRNPNPQKGDIVGWDFVHNDPVPFDDHSHGTHCAGTVGAVGGNGKAISGVAQKVSIMALKFLDSNGSGDLASAIKAIDYAVDNGAKILSNSWGAQAPLESNRALLDAILRAEKKGVLFVAAAGNDSSNNDTDPGIPASFETPNMLSVAATDSNDKLASFSNFGKRTVHLGAPGVNIYSTVPGNNYKRYSGTSMACPHVAGAAALVWSTNPSMNYKEVRERLLKSVDRVQALEGKTATGGRLNVARALGLK